MFLRSQCTPCQNEWKILLQNKEHKQKLTNLNIIVPWEGAQGRTRWAVLGGSEAKSGKWAFPAVTKLLGGNIKGRDVRGFEGGIDRR